MGLGSVIAPDNGCCSCSLRNNLSEAVTTLGDSPYGPDILVIEASGVADPAGIISLFENEDLKKRVRIAGVICLVDAEEIFSVSWIMSHLVKKQIRSADLLLLNKVDRVSESKKAAYGKSGLPLVCQYLIPYMLLIPVSLIWTNLIPEP